MAAKESSWFVHLGGRTLGPIRLGDLQQSILRGEISPADKVTRTDEAKWRPVSEHQELAHLWEARHPNDFLAEVPARKKKTEPAGAYAQETPAKVSVPSQNRNPSPSAASSVVTVRAAIAAPIPAPVPAPAKVVVPPPPPPMAAKAPAAPPPKVTHPERAPSKPKKKIAKRAAPRAKKKKIAKKETKAAAKIAPATPDLTEALKVLEAVAIPRAPEPIVVATPAPKVEVIETILVSPAPAERPSMAVFLDEPKSTPAPEKAGTPVVTLRTGIFLVLVIAAVAVVAFYSGQKMRDLKEFPLPDPSSPTLQPPTASDPISPLKAPTRPNRD